MEALHWGLGYSGGAAVGGVAFEYQGAIWTFWMAAFVALGMTFSSCIIEWFVPVVEQSTEASHFSTLPVEPDPSCEISDVDGDNVMLEEVQHNMEDKTCVEYSEVNQL